METIDSIEDHELNGDLESAIVFLQEIADSNKDKYHTITITCRDGYVYIDGIRKNLKEED